MERVGSNMLFIVINILIIYTIFVGFIMIANKKLQGWPRRFSFHIHHQFLVTSPFGLYSEPSLCSPLAATQFLTTILSYKVLSIVPTALSLASLQVIHHTAVRVILIESKWVGVTYLLTVFQGFAPSFRMEPQSSLNGLQGCPGLGLICLWPFPPQ
jgi:hypothetical protein